jgi:hypothetical protein
MICRLKGQDGLLDRDPRSSARSCCATLCRSDEFHPGRPARPAGARATAKDEALEQALIASVHGIAQGLQNTGLAYQGIRSQRVATLQVHPGQKGHQHDQKCHTQRMIDRYRHGRILCLTARILTDGDDG